MVRVKTGCDEPTTGMLIMNSIFCISAIYESSGSTNRTSNGMVYGTVQFWGGAWKDQCHWLYGDGVEDCSMQ